MGTIYNEWDICICIGCVIGTNYHLGYGFLTKLKDCVKESFFFYGFRLYI